MARKIEYYRLADGKCPVADFLGSLSPVEQRKVFWVLKLIEDLERIPAEYFKKLVNTDEIWECRIHCGTNAYRIFSFFFRGDTVVLTHGYSKKSQKTDSREISKAEGYRSDYLTRKAGGKR